MGTRQAVQGGIGQRLSCLDQSKKFQEHSRRNERQSASSLLNLDMMTITG